MTGSPARGALPPVCCADSPRDICGQMKGGGLPVEVGAVASPEEFRPMPERVARKPGDVLVMFAAAVAGRAWRPSLRPGCEV